MVIHSFDSLESTNKYCEALDLAEVEDFTCYWALEQTAGIGQRGNHWHSAPGQNLTFSLVLHPAFLTAARQFCLTQALSLALIDLLSIFNSQFSIQIKWPNDIYVDGRKICGTLISTRLDTARHPQPAIHYAVCGIGLNVNETAFPAWVPNPTSLRLLTGQEYELEPLLQQLLQHIGRRYDALRRGDDLEEEYLSHLLGLGVPARYRYQGSDITATIDGVDAFGRLLLTAADGTHLRCNLKEIALLQQ
jgi:BirA family biotin operon repressor/biotin-[acetyl-CoA-carboxylase] ligase